MNEGEDDGSAYDLSRAAADLELWDGPPRRSILLCSHPRSGSTLTGEMLHAAGGLGVPLEYFHVGFRPYLQSRFGADNLDAYVRAVHSRRTEPNGTFSAKLFWRDVEELAHERDPDGQPGFGLRPLGSLNADDYRRIWALIADLFPDPIFIHLVRKDRIRAAVSALAATQSGHWRSIPDGKDRSPEAEPRYDRERIQRLIDVSDYCNGHWARLFEALNVSAYAVTYEALDADLAGQTAALLAHLGRSATEPAAPRMRRQSNAVTEAMVLRYIREQAAMISRP